MAELRNIRLSSPSCENIGVSIKPGATAFILFGAISFATPLTRFSTAPPTAERAICPGFIRLAGAPLTKTIVPSELK